jgi:hypothetical protein
VVLCCVTGGIGDRLRGLTFVFLLSLILDRVLLIHWENPLPLSSLFVPRSYDWAFSALHRVHYLSDRAAAAGEYRHIDMKWNDPHFADFAKVSVNQLHSMIPQKFVSIRTDCDAYDLLFRNPLLLHALVERGLVSAADETDYLSSINPIHSHISPTLHTTNPLLTHPIGFMFNQILQPSQQFQSYFVRYKQRLFGHLSASSMLTLLPLASHYRAAGSHFHTHSSCGDENGSGDAHTCPSPSPPTSASPLPPALLRYNSIHLRVAGPQLGDSDHYVKQHQLADRIAILRQCVAQQVSNAGSSPIPTLFVSDSLDAHRLVQSLRDPLLISAHVNDGDIIHLDFITLNANSLFGRSLHSLYSRVSSVWGWSLPPLPPTFYEEMMGDQSAFIHQKLGQPTERMAFDSVINALYATTAQLLLLAQSEYMVIHIMLVVWCVGAAMCGFVIFLITI